MVSSISCNLLTAVPKVKSSGCGGRDVTNATVADPGDGVAAWEPWLLPSITGEYPLHITSLGKDPNSRSGV